MGPEHPTDPAPRAPGTGARPPARQDIPRPPWALRVEPAVDGLEPADPARELTMGAVRGALSALAAAGAAAMSQAGTVPVAPVTPGAAAAVLITLVPTDQSGDASPAAVVLIRRATHLRRNPGEIGFPGGSIEPGEEPLAAALREAEEEVGLPRGAVEVLGRLSAPAPTRLSDLIIAFVGAASDLPLLEANTGEVEAILVVPLAELVAPGRYWQERWDEDESPTWTMHFFDLGEDVIWGATARMLYTLLLRVLRGRETSPVL